MNCPPNSPANRPAGPIRPINVAHVSPVSSERSVDPQRGGPMRVARFVLTFLLIFVSSPHLNSQHSATAAQRDPQALAVLNQAVTAMGGSVPGDSSATGTVTITAGSDTQAGTIKILTRGSSQTLEQITTSSGSAQVVYSNGFANDSNHIATKAKYSLELATSSQSALFPLPLVSAVLSSSDFALQYIGQENIDGAGCHHLRTWNTYSSQPDLQYLSPFSYREIWINATTGLPSRIAYSMRAGSGAEPSIAVEVSYSNYQSAGGVLFPFQISRSLNGTPWMTIIISSVSFNNGLTDSTFSNL